MNCKLLNFAGFVLLGTSTILAQTLYWGGGDTDITSPTPLPTLTSELSGTWDDNTKNWSVDPEGSSYVAWSEVDGAKVAVFGAGITVKASVDTNMTITVVGDKMLNGIEIRLPTAAGKHVYVNGSSPITFTFGGESPYLVVAGDNNQTLIFNANIAVAGTAGLRFSSYSGSYGLARFKGDASKLTGTIYGNSPRYSNFITEGGLGSDEAIYKAGAMQLYALSGNQNAYPDNFRFVATGQLSNLSLYGRAGATEAIGQFVMQSGSAEIDLANRNGSAPNGVFTLSHPTAGIDRGKYGLGMLVLKTQSDNSIRTDLHIANGISAGLLPWAMTSYARLVELDQDKYLRPVMNTDAPLDVSLWSSSSDYRMTGAPVGTLGSITLNSLTAYFNGITPTLSIDDAATLTLTRGILGLQRTGGVVSLKISGGKLTTPADILYINLGATDCTLTLENQLVGNFDIVTGGDGNVYLSGSAPNTYQGTFWSGAKSTLYLRKSTGNGPAITGDLVVPANAKVVFSSYGYDDQQIVRQANITIENDASFTGGGNAGTHDFGGIVTINGGTWLGNSSTSHHAFDAPGFGLRFNGGLFGSTVASSAGNYYILTDVSYAETSDKQAFFEASNPAQKLNLTEAGLGAGVRTFAITNSVSLPPDVPEMLITMELAEANTTEKAGLTKVGSGELTISSLTASLTGDVTVEEGRLTAAASWDRVVREGVTASSSAVIKGLASTADIRTGQAVSGTGIPADTFVRSIDSDSEITLNQNANASGTAELTFHARSSLASAQVISGTRVKGSPIISGLASTANLALWQRVTGTDIPGSTFIVSIDSASQITLSKNASNSGTAALTFASGSPTGTAPITAKTNGTLAGDGVLGTVTIASGGRLDPGRAAGEVGTFVAAAGVTFQEGSVLHIDLAGANADLLDCRGDLLLAGEIEVAAVNGYELPREGQWLIAMATGDITGTMDAADGFSVKIVDNQVWLRCSPGGTVLIVR